MHNFFVKLFDAAKPILRPIGMLVGGKSARDFYWRLKSRELLRLPDRVFFESRVLPFLAARGARQVLYLGCRMYTAHYPERFEQAGMMMWTADIDPEAARFGAPGRHLVRDATALSRADFPVSFDAAVFSGVIGYGLNDPAAIGRALGAMADLLAPGGVLVLGWNTDRSIDPAGTPTMLRYFTRLADPALPARTAFDGVTHVFDVFERNATPAGSMQ